MTTVPKPAAKPRLLKAEALLRPEYEGPHELWDGVLMVREPSSFDAGAVAATIGALLVFHVSRRKLGRVSGSSAGYVLARGPDRVLVPDAAFVAKERLRIIAPRGFAEGPPDLAVEVRSPSESWISVVRKTGIWLGHGTKVVWAVDPETRIVVVSRGFAPPETLTTEDTLDGAPVLPKFRVKVARLFNGL
jgi:Uma2 family endonuclease